MFESSLIMYFFIGFVGLFLGSFLNVLADRLPQERTLMGRSECDSCKHVLQWFDLIPIISFTLLNGKCRYCNKPINFQYPLIEIITSVVLILTYILSLKAYFSPSLHIIHLVIAAILIVMLLSDFRYQILPDEMQVALFIMGLLKIFILYSDGILLTGLKDHGIAAVVVMLPLLAVFLLTRGRGMGFGDVKYAVNMGILLGLWNGLAAMYLAFIVGGVVGGTLLLSKKGNLKSKIAFGPFLILGTYLMLFFENEIILFLSRIYGF